MQLPRFEHVRASTLRDASRILAALGDGARLVAGGTDLFPRMKYRLATPRTLVSLQGVSPREPAADPSGDLWLDAVLPLSRLARSAAVRERAPQLADAAHRVASCQVRHRGTLGGNLCLETRCLYYNQSHAFQFVEPCLKRGGAGCYFAPRAKRCWAVFAGDTAPALVSLGAQVEVVGPPGTRLMPLEELYTGDPVRPIGLAHGEVLGRVLVPAARGRQSGAFGKFSARGGVEFAAVSVAVALEFGEDGETCTWARIAVGSVSAAPERARRAEAVLTGKRPTPEVVEAAARLVPADVRPVAHHGYSAPYLRHCLGVQARRALVRAVDGRV